MRFFQQRSRPKIPISENLADEGSHEHSSSRLRRKSRTERQPGSMTVHDRPPEQREHSMTAPPTPSPRQRDRSRPGHAERPLEPCRDCTLHIKSNTSLSQENMTLMVENRNINMKCQEQDEAYQREILRMQATCESLQKAFDLRSQELEMKLMEERSLLQSWTIKAREREHNFNEEINELRKHNHDLYARLSKKGHLRVSHDEIRSSINAWYSVLTTFCPKYFPYPYTASTASTDALLPIEDFHGNLASSGAGESHFFYHERQARLFESILFRVSESFLVAAHQSEAAYLTELRSQWQEGHFDATSCLPLLPSLITGILRDDHIHVTLDELAHDLHAVDTEHIIKHMPQWVRYIVHEAKLLVQADMKPLRDTENCENIAAADHRQLEELIELLTILLLNTETSGLKYKFVAIKVNAPFDKGRMEPIETPKKWLDASMGASVVHIAMTRPLMECDEAGVPVVCIAKAKVILKSHDR